MRNEATKLIAEVARAAAPVFERMGWEYARNSDERYTPDAVDLALMISRLWEECEDGSSNSSGRWTVESVEDEDQPGVFHKVIVLEFEASA